MTVNERFCAHFLFFCFFLYNGSILLYNEAMKRLREICLSPWFLIAAQILLTGAIAVGAVFYPYVSVAAYRLWKVVLIDLTFAICSGTLFAFTYFHKHPDCKAWHLDFPFFVGAGVFCALFFGGQAIAAHYAQPSFVCLIGASVALAFDLACVVAQDVFAVRRDRKFFLYVTVPIVIGVYVAATLLSLMLLPQGLAFKSFSKDRHAFAVASAEEFAVTDADKQAVTDFYEKYFDGFETPVFDFSLGGDSFRSVASQWAHRSEADLDTNIDRWYYTSPSALEVCLEVVLYEETLTVEWTVYLKNKGMENSLEITDLYAMDAVIDVVSPTLYFSGGSNEANDDFALYSRSLGKKGYTFSAASGRSSETYLPFFNLCGKDRGATLGIGWSGDWTASFSHTDQTKVRVGQSALCGYLAPGESIRTPSVAVSLYAGGNPLKGFNRFRADIKRGLGDRAKESNMLMFAGAEGQDDTSRADAAGTREYVAALRSAGVLDALDYAWYDAGWYDTAGTGDWRGSVGDWVVDTQKYPGGLGAVGAYLEEYGVKTLLWYEPERVPVTSNLFKTVSATAGCERWLITSSCGDALWNMGDAEACAYMVDRIATSLLENDVFYYRQDFNMDPKPYWEKADKEFYDGRTGFAENMYVTGEYAFLDALLNRVPDLKIDNCASGGRRIDLEMCRRAVPLWRSDYQCKKEETDLSEAAQYQTYGLGLWLPYSCITNPNASSEYDFRSLLGGYVMCYGDVLFDAKDAYVSFVRDYQTLKTYFAQNYYPLTPCTPRENFVAMQFGEETAGAVILYARDGAKGTKTVKLNGLSENKTYSVRTIEGVALKNAKGADLMRNGVTISTEERTAYIILYSEE